MVRTSLARISGAGFSLLLSAALLFMIGGLVASDRAIARSTAAEARIDAEQSSVIVAQVLVARLASGVAPADLHSDFFLRSAVERAPIERAAAALISGADTIFIVGNRLALVRGVTDAVPLALPGAVRWKFVVAYDRGVGGLRIALWVVSLTTVTLLGFGLIRERRQAQRVAERSAELERLYSEVARANTAKSEFLANISH